MPRQSNRKKRQSPSDERKLALALVRLIECIGLVEIAQDQEEFADLDAAAKEGIALLEATGYGSLRSIQSCVKEIEVQIAEALKAQDGAKLAILGAALDRAKAGKPPLTTEKKTRKPLVKKKTPAETTPPKERKPRKKKGVDPVLRDDRQPEATESADDGDSAWLTHHPEPK